MDSPEQQMKKWKRVEEVGALLLAAGTLALCPVVGLELIRQPIQDSDSVIGGLCMFSAIMATTCVIAQSEISYARQESRQQR